jgi:hypothetical protein
MTLPSATRSGEKANPIEGTQLEGVNPRARLRQRHASDCSVWVVRPMSSWPRRTKVARRQILAPEQWLPALIYRCRLSDGCQPAKILEATTRPVEMQETGFPQASRGKFSLR